MTMIYGIAGTGHNTRYPLKATDLLDAGLTYITTYPIDGHGINFANLICQNAGKSELI